MNYFVPLSSDMTFKDYSRDAVALLSDLIAIPSISREEQAAADLFDARMERWGLSPKREGNNIWAVAPGYDAGRETILLNAHIDTVKPVASWTRDPFSPTIEGDRLYGLGANDCGGGLVALLAAFRMLRESESSNCSENSEYSENSEVSLKKKNLIFLASCEEEVSGADGIRRVLPLLPKIDVAIVGEPTGMQPAVAEKGLMVLELTAHGKSGHAARREGVNALYQMLDDLCFIRDYHFERVSPLLGETLMQATVINAGTQHNVVPDRCEAIVDVRTNELYNNEEVLHFLQSRLKSDVKARSTRLSSSSIPLTHPLVEQLIAKGKQPFGSPTLSDQALMPFPSLKLGPGDSARSHSADEYICIAEIEDAIETYVQLLS